MSQKKGLGRGFDSLIPTDLFDDSFDPTAKQDVSVSELGELPLDDIHANPDQPRKHFSEEALEELAQSIREHGVLQPIIVANDGKGYQIVAGERRYRASKLAGMKSIPVIIRTFTDQHQLEVSLIENIQRRDLNAIETATAYAKLRDQFNMTNEQISQRVHKSVPSVMNTLRLLKLPKEVIVAIAEGTVTEGQARPLIGQPEDFILEVLPRILAENWSARKVEQLVANRKKEAKPAADNRVAEAYEKSISTLRERLNTGVSVQVNAKGAGRIVIAFSNDEEFERLKNQLG